MPVESDTDRIFRVDTETGESEVYADDVGRLPDGLALDAEGNLYAGCYASDDIYRITMTRQKTLYAYDRWAILLSRPTNLQFHDGYLYVSNLGRTTITRARVEVLTTRTPHGPSRDWLNFVASAGARSKIRAWFKRQNRDENIARGRELLEHELGRLEQRTLGSLAADQLSAVASSLEFKTPDDLWKVRLIEEDFHRMMFAMEGA